MDEEECECPRCRAARAFDNMVTSVPVDMLPYVACHTTQLIFALLNALKGDEFVEEFIKFLSDKDNLPTIIVAKGMVMPPSETQH